MAGLMDINVVKLPRANFSYVTDIEEARKIVEELKKYDVLPVDTETTGLDPFTSKLVLVQIGIPGYAYVFDVRNDTKHSNIDLEVFRPIMTDKSITKVFHNAVFDMKFIKTFGGYYVEGIYDTFLAEQLLFLGVKLSGFSLAALVEKYLGLSMDKEPRNTFEDYNQTFEDYQLEYAANDVLVLTEIKDSQMRSIIKHELEDAARLEFEFTKPMCEMELNGITMNADRWRKMMVTTAEEKDVLKAKIGDVLSAKEDQNTMFGVSLVNLESPAQLKKSLNNMGLNMDSTDVKALSKYKGVPVIDDLLKYRKMQKLVSTYGDALLDRINPVTGRLHTQFKQMVSTGRMSSSNPNLQNIPKKQKFRSGFVAKEGYVLVTADMSGAELRILGNLSNDEIFIDSYARGVDLHTRTSSEVFGVPMSEVTHDMRNAAKAINFGLCYGMSVVGLSQRLGISKDKAEEMINIYFERYHGVKKYLDKAGRDGVRYGFSRTISGRKRFYNIPNRDHPDYRRLSGSVERQSKNAGIQGSNADTIKQSMIYLVDRLEVGNYDARLLLTVHDEVVVETVKEQAEEVRKVVAQSLVDGFARYFSTIPMTTDALLGPCWLKSSCENKDADGHECGGTEMKFVSGGPLGTKLVCGKCEGDME